MAYFPMFVNIEEQNCLLIGGGKVALRKLEYLQDFGARVTLVAEEILPEIKEKEGFILIEKSYEESGVDLEDYMLVILATNDKAFNHKMSQACKELRIPVNAVDDKEACSFILPSYLKEENLVAAFSSGGDAPVAVQYLKEKNRKFITPNLGKLVSYLGSLRPRVKAEYKSIKERKAIYQEILQTGVREKWLMPLEEAAKTLMREKGKE